MIPISHRHDNYAPRCDPAALEAFLARRRVRAERAVKYDRALSCMTTRQLDKLKRYASFLPPGSNIHRANNLYLPDLATDPFAALVVFLAHFNTSADAIGPGGAFWAATLTGAPPMTIGAPAMFGAGALQIPTGTDRCRYSATGIIFGNGAVTHELWFDRTTASGPRVIMASTLVGGSFFVSLNLLAGNIFGWNMRGGAVSTGAVLPPSTYSALAVSVAAGTGVNTAHAFVNGVLVNSGTPNVGNAGTCTTFGIGDTNNALSGIAGSVDEYRITLAQRYTASYTPTGPFPNP